MKAITKLFARLGVDFLFNKHLNDEMPRNVFRYFSFYVTFLPSFKIASEKLCHIFGSDVTS